MARSTCLSLSCMIIGTVFSLCSIAGIGLSLFLIFGEPLPQYEVRGTYSPSWEDIGPALIVSIVSLLVNVLLIGGAKQMSKEFLLVWIVWKAIVLLLFWAWYGYSQLKHYGYIDWTAYGMKGCYFCELDPEATYVVFGGVAFTVAILFSFVPVEVLRSRLKKQHRELTETANYFGEIPHNNYPNAYEMREQEYLQRLQQQQRDYILQQQYQPYQPYHQPQPSQYYPSQHTMQYR